MIQPMEDSLAYPLISQSKKLPSKRGERALLIEGIWRGKKEESWNQERVRLSTENMNSLTWLIDFERIAG